MINHHKSSPLALEREANDTNTRVLAIESSCDETSCAVVNDLWVESNVIASQVQTHAKFGGIVPEIASRYHLDAIVPVVREALEQANVTFDAIDAIAVTHGPGLAGALLVGIQMARGLALALDKPLYGIHHLEGHLVSACLGDEQQHPILFEPHIALVVSGGHTELIEVKKLGQYRILGATRDDAAGEAFDKVAKMLGLGYPGGPVIDRLAEAGDSQAFEFPRAMLRQQNFEFSFSGLKTAVAMHLDQHGQPQSHQHLCDICAAFQAAVVDVLVNKACMAVKKTKSQSLHVVGGVAANSGLRAGVMAAAQIHNFTATMAPLRYCGDNAAMIAGAAALRIKAGFYPLVEMQPSIPLDDPSLWLSQ